MHGSLSIYGPVHDSLDNMYQFAGVKVVPVVY